MKVSVELVPREREELRTNLCALQSEIQDVDMINIPDLLRCEIRSWQGAALSKEYFKSVIPHIRAIDIDLSQPLPIKTFLREKKITKVLVIEGDPPQDMSHEIYPTVSTDVIRKFREEMPEVEVYAGIDQYRGSMRSEQYRIKRKLQAGAAGFFTQPFFDMRYLAIYSDMLAGLNIFWGVSPIDSPRSKHYWELKNNVIFPADFAPTIAWSVDFARQVLTFARQHQDNVYLMPIKAEINNYLRQVFAE